MDSLPPALLDFISTFRLDQRMLQWGKKPVCAPVLRHPPRRSPQRPNACANAEPDTPKGHMSAGLLMGYVRLLVEPQSQLVSLDGLMRNGLVSELKAGLPQKVLRKGKRGQNLGVGPGMGHILPIGIVQYPYVPKNCMTSLATWSSFLKWSA
jgi:hypothetical protein